MALGSDGHSFTVGDKEDRSTEDLAKKWSKANQLVSANNLGYFVAHPLYIKLHELLKGTYSTYKVYFNELKSIELFFSIQISCQINSNQTFY